MGESRAPLSDLKTLVALFTFLKTPSKALIEAIRTKEDSKGKNSDAIYTRSLSLLRARILFARLRGSFDGYQSRLRGTLTQFLVVV